MISFEEEQASSATEVISQKQNNHFEFYTCIIIILACINLCMYVYVNIYVFFSILSKGIFYLFYLKLFSS